MNRCASRLALTATFFLLWIAPALEAQQAKQPAPPAPVPAQITAAKKLFVANLAAEDWAYSGRPFNGGVNRAYDTFYAAVKTTNKFELVTTPADADLLLELELHIPAGEHQWDKDLMGGAQNVPFDPQFRLAVRDPKTGASLWGFTEHFQWAVLQGNRDRNYDQAINKLANSFLSLATQAGVASEGAKP